MKGKNSNTSSMSDRKKNVPTAVCSKLFLLFHLHVDVRTKPDAACVHTSIAETALDGV